MTRHKKWLSGLQCSETLTNLTLHLGYDVSGDELVSINGVTLRQARLLLGWVTVCGHDNHLGM